MKRCVFIAVYLFSFLNIHSQISFSENELKSYYENNIYELNPLEGIYFVKHSHNLFFEDEINTYTRAIMYSNQKNTYNELYFDKDTNKYKFLQKIQYDNTTHVLRYFSDNGQSIISEHVVSNPSHFITKHGDQNTYDNTEYTRLYPTEEMLSGTNIEIKVQEAGNLIKNGYFSSALSILNDVLKTHGNPRGYYLRGGAHYGLKNYNAAIQDCNKALSYNINTNNASAVYYLRGLCHFLIEDKESGISDMEKAGEDGIKFLEENGFKKTKSVQKQNNNSRKVPTTKRNNSTPVLKKNK